MPSYFLDCRLRGNDTPGPANRPVGRPLDGQGSGGFWTAAWAGMTHRLLDSAKMFQKSQDTIDNERKFSSRGVGGHGLAGFHIGQVFFDAFVQGHRIGYSAEGPEQAVHLGP